MRLIFFFFLFFSSFVFANLQDEVSADEVSVNGITKDQAPAEQAPEEQALADEVSEDEVSADQTSADEAKKGEGVQGSQYLFEDYFFFEDSGSLETRLSLQKSPVYRVSSSSFSLLDRSALDGVAGNTVSAFAERDHSEFLLKEFSQVIYPWNFFINQFFFLHDIRFSIYVENTYLYSDMASSFYENFQNINVKPESVWYFRFRYIW